MPKPNKPMKLKVVVDKAVDFDQLPEHKRKIIGEVLARMLMRQREAMLKAEQSSSSSQP